MNNIHNLMVETAKEIGSEVIKLRGTVNSITGRHSVHAYKKFHSELRGIELEAHETLYDDYLSDDEAYNALVDLKEELAALGCKIAKEAK